MKELFKYYSLELFYCFLISLSAALAKFVSPLFILLMIYPISKGRIVGVIDKKLREDPETGKAFISVAFLVLVGILLLGAFTLPDQSFISVTLGGSVFCGIVVTIILMFRLHALSIPESKTSEE